MRSLRPCSDSSTAPSFPSQPEGKIGLPRANPRGRLTLGWEDPLEERMATHSGNLARIINGQGNLVGCRLWGAKYRFALRDGTWDFS